MDSNSAQKRVRNDHILPEGAKRNKNINVVPLAPVAPIRAEPPTRVGGQKPSPLEEETMIMRIERSGPPKDLSVDNNSIDPGEKIEIVESITIQNETLDGDILKSTTDLPKEKRKRCIVHYLSSML